MSGAYYSADHLAALRRFAVAITVLTILGHAYFGFEQSIAQPLTALGTAYALQILLEAVESWSGQRRPRFAGGVLPLVNFLLPAHITALATTMLLYVNDRLWIVAFATAVGIASKTLFRAPIGSRTRHFLNPSNFGITVTLLLFPWVGLAPPWQFTANLSEFGDWALPALIFVLGSFINLRYTRRAPLIAAWLLGFVAQAVLRSVLAQASLLASLAPASGVIAMLFTFYMAPDPATTPDKPWAQVVFGASIAAIYAFLVSLHVAFALFYALTLVCFLRGFGLYALHFWSRPHRQAELVAARATMG